MLIKHLNLYTRIIIISFLFTSCTTGNISKLDELPRIIGSVNDYYNLLTKEQNEYLKNKLQSIFLQTRTNIVILIVNSTNGISIENYASQIMNSTKMEISMSPEILFVYAMDDRKLRLEVTGESELLLSNELCQQIVENIVESFKQGNYFQGIKEGIIQVQVILMNNINLKTTPNKA